MSRAVRSASASARFFVRVGGVKRSARRCEATRPLFPLWLILEADATLAAACRPLVKATRA